MALHPIGQCPWWLEIQASQFPVVSQGYICPAPAPPEQTSPASVWHTVCSVSLVCAWCNIYQLVDSVDRTGSEAVCVCFTLLPGWVRFHGNGLSCHLAWRKAQRITLLGTAACGPMGLSFPLGSFNKRSKASSGAFPLYFPGLWKQSVWLCVLHPAERLDSVI